ncbi:MAG: tetratricopeptide repeat protein [Anaerolineae bacterium]|nr:tetratricopeptide repeat protein [Anaerolineae bacterium]
MAQDTLTDAPNYTDFFLTALLANIAYWQNNPAVQSLEVEALDQEREGLIRAIFYGLTAPEAWPAVGQLIETLSPYMERRGYWAVWQQVLDQALAQAQQRNDAARCVVFSLLLARLLQRQSKIKQTIHHYRWAINFARQAGSQYNEGRACTNLGYLYIELGQWFRAEVLCCYALGLFEQIKNEHGQAHTHNHLGILFTWQGIWHKAEHHLELACAVWQRMNDHHGLMRGLINLGSLYLLKQQPVRALSCLQDAADYANLTGDELELATIYMNQGIAHQYNSNLVDAEHCIQRAEVIYHKFSNLPGLAQAWSNLGIACLEQGQIDEGGQFLLKSLDTWRKLNNRQGELKALAGLIEYEFMRKDHSQATAKLKELKAIKARHLPHFQDPYLNAILQKYHYSLTE